MNEHPIPISNLNDFIFCPVSIYFHQLYGEMDRIAHQDSPQLKGSAAHEAIDSGTYSDSKRFLLGISVYSEQYGVYGKIDILDLKKEELIERKRKIKTIYDGYVFQLYAQFFALTEMGYSVKNLAFYSSSDNKKYPIPLPQDNEEMLNKFEQTIEKINSFDPEGFEQENKEKCRNCIYEPACDRTIKEHD